MKKQKASKSSSPAHHLVRPGWRSITHPRGCAGAAGRGRQFSGSSPRREAQGRGSCGPGLP